MKSCYAIELSVLPGSARRADVFVRNDLDALRGRLEREFARDEPADAYHVGLVFYGQTTALWIVQRGRAVACVDLAPHITMLDASGRAARLDDRAALEAIEDDFNADPTRPVTFEIDWAAVAAKVPPLEPPWLMPGESTGCELDASVVPPDTGSYLEHGATLQYGDWDHEEGAEISDGAG